MACGSCIKKIAANKTRTSRLNKLSAKNKVCKYSKQQLEDSLPLLTSEYDKSIVRSQINIYFTNCKAFEFKIDEIFKTLK